MVVGDAGTVLTSPDGRTWTRADAATTHDLREVVFGHGVFLARGSQWVVTSSDAIHWQAQQPQGPDRNDPFLGKIEWTLSGLAFGQGVFVLSGYSRLTPAVPHASPYNRPALFVSANGRDWQNFSDEVIAATGPVGSLGNTAFGNAVFAILHSRGTLHSETGIHWTLTPGVAFNDLRFESGHFLAVTPPPANPAVPNPLFTSADGRLWEELPRASVPDATRDLYEVAYGNGRFVVAGQGVTLASAEGVVWNWRFQPGDRSPRGLVSGRGVWVALSSSGVPLTSSDGVDWTPAALDPPGVFTNVRFVQGRFLAVGRSGALADSTDGWRWTRRSSGVTADLVDAASDGTQTLVVDKGGTVLRSSAGLAWVPVSIPGAGDLSGIAAGNHRWVISADLQSYFWSEDGNLWTREVVSGAYLRSPVRFEANRFCMLAVAAAFPAGMLLASGDGKQWTALDHFNESYVSDSVTLPRLTVALTLPGTGVPPGYVTLPGTIWVAAWSDPAQQPERAQFTGDWKLRAVAWGAGRFVAVGDAGVVLTSNLILPRLSCEADRVGRRVRLSVADPADHALELEFSPDLVVWSSRGIFEASEWPVWLELPSGGAGFYRVRAVSEPERFN